ncbi:MAG: M20/M25/M40 family metallo-hydrolase [Cystobacter sp.]
MSRFGFRLALVGLLGFAGACTPTEEPAEGGQEQLQRYIDEHFFDDLSTFVAARTYRGVDLTEAQVVANLGTLQDELRRQTEQFNAEQKVHKLTPFEWKKTVNGQEYWLFGVRVGSGPRRVALSSHLDTVAPGTQDGWNPFTLVKEQREYMGKNQEFYVGRGAIDDKGPAIIAYNVLKAVARQYDGDERLDRVTLEVLFDTSEETDMAMPYYLEDRPEENPDMGIIFDAMWSVRAEKGIERPAFTVRRQTPALAPLQGVWIETLDTPKGPANQIPDSATAVLRADKIETLEAFAQEVESLYQAHGFDDATYRRAPLTVDRSDLANKGLILQTRVSGAQHGSAPDENRAEGTNPLISLANFLGAHVGTRLERNEVGELAQFITWGWGTQVYGEHHPDLLLRDDQVFQKGNGTTYAITRFYTNPAGAPNLAARVEIDIRYALGHHSASWDGKTEGLVGGKGSPSRFQETFTELIKRFPTQGGYPLSFQTRTAYAPDVRLPEGGSFKRISTAFEEVLGEQSPALAIGGGTDAKGNNNLIAAGPLFTTKMGPPINYHGFNEGAPVGDLRKSADVLYRMLADEVESAQKVSLQKKARPLYTPMRVTPDAH